MAFVALLLLLAASANPTAAAKVQVLDLSLRGLTNLDDAPLSSNLSVGVAWLAVNLSGNAITSWGTQPFRNLWNVTVLDLSCNQLRSVDGLALADIPNVRELNLSDNAVETLVGRPFRTLVKLVHLDLSDNKLRTLVGSSLGDLVALQRLNLRGNALLALEDADLRGLARLQRLDVSNNAIRSAAAGALRGLNGLGELSAGDNPDVGSIVVVGKRLFRVSMPRAGLTAVPATLTRSVRTLVLQGNLLTAIASGDLDSYPLLRELDLSFNRLDIIEDDALGRLEQLAVLRLAGNRLRVVPPGLPAGLISLQLDHNHIRSLNVGDFQGLHHLQELSLKKNNLRELPAGVFRLMGALETFDLSGNPLVALHADWLEGLSRLRVLHLKSLTELEKPASWLPFPVASERLTYLDVSGSRVLASQLLSDTAALTAMRQLTELRMKQCELTTLRADLPSLLVHVRRLQLDDNPWNCSESLLLWLPAWIASLEIGNARCANPTHLHDRSLSSLLSARGSTDSGVKSSFKSITTPIFSSRRYPLILTTPPPTEYLSPAVTTTYKHKSSTRQDKVLEHTTLTAVKPNVTIIKTISLLLTLASTTPSSVTNTQNSTLRISKFPEPEKSKRVDNLTSSGSDVLSSPSPDKLNKETSETQIPADMGASVNVHLIPALTPSRDTVEQDAINYSAWTTITSLSSVINDGLNLMSASAETQSGSATSEAATHNSSDQPQRDPDVAYVPPREALTAEHSRTSSLVTMFGVGAVGSALVLFVLAAAHAAPKLRLDFASLNDVTTEEDDDDVRTELW